MVHNKAVRAYGITQALRSAGMSQSQFNIVKSARQALTTEGSFDIMMAKAAACLFETTGKQAAEAYPIFVKLASLTPEQWSPGYAPFTEAFMSVMNRAADIEQEGHRKEATQNGVLPDVGRTAASALQKVSPALLNSLLMGSLLLGTGTGALSWHLGRDMSQDDVNNAQMREQARTYRDLADEVNREVKLRKMQMGAPR